MCTQLLGALTNIILDPILIFGLFGAPRLGVAGAAVATVTGQCVAAVAALIMNLKCNPDIHIVPRKIRFHGPTVKNIYRIGFPSIVMQCIGSVMVFGVNRILISFTTTATAVFGAYFKLQSFIFMPVFGLNNGMVPIVAYNYGAKKPDRVKKTIKLAIFSAVAIMAVGLAAFELAPGALLSLFDASENMLAIGTPALRIIALSFVLAGFCIISMSVCQAIGNPIYSLVVSVCPSAGGPAPGGVAAVPDGQPHPGLAGLPHRRAHVPDPQRHLPAQNPSHGRARHDPVRLLTHRPCL
ncbi:MAG: MATE family efflux transporter [Evtepia gabavorous]